MPHLGNDSVVGDSKYVIDGVLFSNEAVEFAALGLIARRNGCLRPQLHLYAIAIELAFKSLALRVGATLKECKDASHKISEMIKLVEQYGVTVPNDLKRRSDDIWFKNLLLLSRYPSLNRSNSLDEMLLLHRNYPKIYLEMIASILEIPCICPLHFEGGSALTEITNRLDVKEDKSNVMSRCLLQRVIVSNKIR